MTWPTDAQIEQATNHGIEYALAEIAGGATEPRESPLSGEWADDPTSRDVASNVGFVPADPDAETAEAMEELADAWEAGYNDRWASHLNARGGTR